MGQIGSGLAALAAALILGGCQKNEAMAPAAVTPPPAAESLHSGDETLVAMLAAYPEADGATGVVQHAATPASVMPEATRAVFLKQAGETYYLLTAREMKDGCHPCQASLSAFYLSRMGDGFKVDGAYRDFGQSGGWGVVGGISPLTFGAGRTGFSEETGFTNMGCTSVSVSVYLFGATGPVRALNFAPLAKEYEDGNIDIDGAAVTPPPGADFAIRYTGKTGEAGAAPVDATVAYTLKGNELAVVSDEAPEVVKGC